MTNETIRIVGIDPGLRKTGWGVIAVEGSRLRWIAHGVIAPDDKLPFSERLLALMNGIHAVCHDYQVDEAAVEEVFVNVNPASTLKLGQARGAVILGAATYGLPVGEYPANLIKKVVVGAGHADKNQIAYMVARLLPTSKGAKADAADALAVAITHAQLRKRALLETLVKGAA